MAEAAKEKPRTFFGDMRAAFRDALLAAALLSAVGLAVNLAHPEAIPFVASEEYEILVPCPEPGGEVTALEAGDPVLRDEATFVVDARPRQQFESWRFGPAFNVAYDYLEPIPAETLKELARSIASSRARRVVVYGDGDTPDTGEQLAREIAGHGIRNVAFITGGAPRLMSTQQSGGQP